MLNGPDERAGTRRFRPDAGKGDFMSESRRTGRTRILVVDDHEVSSRFTREALRHRNCRVKVCNDAGQAVQLTLEWLPRLIFMDLHLGGSLGLDVLQDIRQRWPTEREAPRFVLLTADRAGIPQSLSSRLGIHAVLLKPVQPAELRRAAGLPIVPRRADTGRIPIYPGFRSIFRQELETRLPELDRRLGALQKREAADIVHQLLGHLADATGAAMKDRNSISSSLPAH